MRWPVNLNFDVIPKGYVANHRLTIGFNRLSWWSAMSGENEKWTEEFKIRPPCSPVGQRLIKILVSRKSPSAPLCWIPDEQSAWLFCCILNCCRVSPAIHFRCAHISFYQVVAVRPVQFIEQSILFLISKHIVNVNSIYWKLKCEQQQSHGFHCIQAYHVTNARNSGSFLFLFSPGLNAI